MSVPLLVPVQITERSGELFQVRSYDDYRRLITTIARMTLQVIQEYPTHYPIFVTQVLYEDDEGINYG